jgi:glutamyl-tRNA reductase
LAASSPVASTLVLVLLGVSHHDLELGELQAIAAGAEGLAPKLIHPVTLDHLEDDGPVRGAVVLSTCNRVEVYLDARRFHDAVDSVTSALAAATGVPDSNISTHLSVRVGAPVAAHLFAVTSGLDSMVVGEAEIAGQVAKALRVAQAEATVSPMLNLLFQRASRTARLVQSKTTLGAAGRSIATVALDVAEASEGSLAGKSALILGTGAFARVVAGALRARGCTDLHVYSGSDRAAGFAERHHARPVSLFDLPPTLKGADLVVACSGNTAGALTPDLLEASGRDRPLTVIDLALRADVSAEVRQLPTVHVIDLLTVARSAPQEQGSALTAAQDIVIAAVADFEDSQAVRALDPAVVALRTHITGVVEREMDRLRNKYDEAVAAELEQAMHRVTRSLLHTPTMRAQELVRSGDGAGFVAALHTLFGIELPGSDRRIAD